MECDEWTIVLWVDGKALHTIVVDAARVNDTHPFHLPIHLLKLVVRDQDKPQEGYFPAR